MNKDKEKERDEFFARMNAKLKVKRSGGNPYAGGRKSDRPAKDRRPSGVRRPLTYREK